MLKILVLMIIESGFISKIGNKNAVNLWALFFVDFIVFISWHVTARDQVLDITESLSVERRVWSVRSEPRLSSSINSVLPCPDRFVHYRLLTSFYFSLLTHQLKTLKIVQWG